MPNVCENFITQNSDFMVYINIGGFVTYINELHWTISFFQIIVERKYIFINKRKVNALIESDLYSPFRRTDF